MPTEEPDDVVLPAESIGTAPGRGRLTGRRILVVGAGSRAGGDPVENGHACAVLAAREGADLVLADRDADAVAVTAAAVRAEGRQADVLIADVSDPDAATGIVGDAGTFDGLVVNVGIGRGLGLTGTTVEDWDTVLAVNLRAHFLLVKAALPGLPAGASVVFTGSAAGLRPGSRSPSYDTSKAALIGLMRHTAAEGAPRVRVNLLVPGLIDTPMGRAASAGRPARARTPIPLRRQGTGWEVAYACLFLLSGESAYVTGQQLVVDGGLTL